MPPDVVGGGWEVGPTYLCGEPHHRVQVVAVGGRGEAAVGLEPQFRGEVVAQGDELDHVGLHLPGQLAPPFDARLVGDREVVVPVIETGSQGHHVGMEVDTHPARDATEDVAAAIVCLGAGHRTRQLVEGGRHVGHVERRAVGVERPAAPLQFGEQLQVLLLPPALGYATHPSRVSNALVG